MRRLNSPSTFSTKTMVKPFYRALCSCLAVSWCQQWCIKSFIFTMRYSTWWQYDPKWKQTPVCCGWQVSVIRCHADKAGTNMGGCPVGLHSIQGTDYGSVSVLILTFPNSLLLSMTCDSVLANGMKVKMIHWVGLLGNLCTRDTVGGHVASILYSLALLLPPTKTGAVTDILQLWGYTSHRLLLE